MYYVQTSRLAYVNKNEKQYNVKNSRLVVIWETQ